MRGGIAGLGWPCHSQVHAVLDVVELEPRYNTVEKLREHPDLARFLRWIRTNPGDLRVTTHRPDERRRAARRTPVTR